MSRPRPRIRVGAVAPCWTRGGAEVHTEMVLRSLDPARFAVQGVAVAGEPFDRAAAEGLPWATSDHPEAPAHLLRQCDLVLSWKFLDLTVPLAGTPHRPRVVFVNHTVEPWGEAHAAALAAVDRVVAVSELALEPVPAPLRGRSSVIWNAVDPGRLAATRDRRAMRRAWGVPEGAKVAGYLGRLSAEKDPGAMGRLAASLPDGWMAVVVGAGPAGIPGHPRLRVVGPDALAGDVLSAFDALVVPSLYESFGLTLAEGLWLGVPAISTEVGLAKMVPGLTRIVPVGATGRELADAVLVDAADPEGTAARVARGKAFARERLGPERFAAEWSALLEDVARRPAPPGPTAAPWFDRAAHDARRLLVLGCDYRGGPVLECGCTKTRVCLAGKGRAVPGADFTDVTDRDCEACVTGA